MKSRRKILFSVLGLFVTIGIIYALLPQKAKKTVRWQIKKQYLILTGGLVSVGDYRLRIECQGSGSPTVIMDSGLNMPLNTWEDVPKEIAKFTRVCVYDRAGIGESEDTNQQLRTSKNVVADINKLLQNADEKPPFILVGHSFGGLNMRLYSSLYPQEVVGLVLIDSSHPDQYQRYANLKIGDEREKYLHHENGANSEGINLLSSADEIKNSPPISSIPLVILSAKNPNPDPEEMILSKDHQELQADLQSLSSKSNLIIVKNSGHFIQKDQPDAVIKAIKIIHETSTKTHP